MLFLLMEKWKQLYDFPGFLISSKGIIKTLDRYVNSRPGVTRFVSGRVLVSRTSKKEPHRFVTVNFIHPKTGEKIMNKTVYIHKAVGDHFITKKKNALYVTHKIKDYDNNDRSNLMWITHKELMNMQPKRLLNPIKSWETRRKLYGKSGYLKTI